MIGGSGDMIGAMWPRLEALGQRFRAPVPIVGALGARFGALRPRFVAQGEPLGGLGPSQGYRSRIGGSGAKIEAPRGQYWRLWG